MRKRLVRLLLAAAVLGLAAGWCARETQRVYATEDSGDEDGEEEDDEDDSYTKELEQKRQDTLDQINSIKSDITTVESKIKDLKNTKSSLQSYINQLDGQVNNLSAQISELEEQISQTEDEIGTRTQELQEAEEDAQEQYEMMKKRICYSYENGTQSFLSAFLEADSLADMMNRVEYARQMSEYDQEMMEKFQATMKDIEEKKTALEEEKAEQEELLAEVQSQKNALNKAMDAKTAEIASYQQQINSASGEQSEYEEQLEEQEKLLAQVENQIAAAAAAKAADGDGDGGSSGFLWPCPSSHRITSYFGNRTAPTAGASTYHKGIDIGASTGSSIVAAASGRVTTSAYSSSAGNYVVISHGNGISTVYMHASARYVSEGDVVTQGQSIAAVGSTGYSTGPHLHFGVIVNGSYVNPLNYVN
ncbi:MAG: peptidoglycan DD-metalloendopeptidase family protein [Eubacteriales bacterium]|nr:peptidoglycan DD-metalloendopeptidase family protein [Eubacteriales bacterium]